MLCILNSLLPFFSSSSSSPHPTPPFLLLTSPGRRGGELVLFWMLDRRLNNRRELISHPKCALVYIPAYSKITFVFSLPFGNLQFFLFHFLNEVQRWRHDSHRRQCYKTWPSTSVWQSRRQHKSVLKPRSAQAMEVVCAEMSEVGVRKACKTRVVYIEDKIISMLSANWTTNLALWSWHL